jgi:hypothetical protein
MLCTATLAGSSLDSSYKERLVQMILILEISDVEIHTRHCWIYYSQVRRLVCFDKEV